MDLNGAYLRYLIAFKDNYFGQWTSYATSEEFAAAGNRSVRYLLSLPFIVACLSCPPPRCLAAVVCS